MVMGMEKAHMFYGMVVVPEQTPRLRVGVVVVLELARLGDVLGPSVPGGAL